MNLMRRRTLTLALAAGLALCPGLVSLARAQTGTPPAPTPAPQTQPPTPPPPETTPPPPETTPPPAPPQTAPTPPATPPPATPAPGTPPSQTPPGTPAPGGTGTAAFGFNFTPPEGWTQAKDTSTITVPGEVCCAWSPDGTSTLVVFRQRPKGAISPRVLLTSSVAAFQKSLGVTVDQQEVREVGGMKAMWMVVTGKGNGAAIDGKSNTPTTQHWVAIPRSNDVLIFLLTAPQEKFATYEAALQKSLGTLQVSGTQTAKQKAAQ
jgi:hypothetical protein